MRRLLPLIALLIPAPALADITATYAVKDKIVTIEVDDGGDVRVGIEGRFALIRHDGIDYVAVFAPNGRAGVLRADAFLDYIARRSPPTPRRWHTALSAGGQAVVAGHPGSVWHFGPEGETPIELVISDDPELAPIGKQFERLAMVAATFIDSHTEAPSDAVKGVGSLFAHGTPIRLRATAQNIEVLTLQSVSRAEIDPHRFDLPGPVVDAATFAAAIAPPSESDSEIPTLRAQEPPKPKD